MNGDYINEDTKCVSADGTAVMKALQNIFLFVRAHYGNYSVLSPVGTAVAAVTVILSHYMSRPTLISKNERCSFRSFQG
jgi:hypothetical protein